MCTTQFDYSRSFCMVIRTLSTIPYGKLEVTNQTEAQYHLLILLGAYWYMENPRLPPSMDSDGSYLPRRG